MSFLRSVSDDQSSPRCLCWHRWHTETKDERVKLLLDLRVCAGWECACTYCMTFLEHAICYSIESVLGSGDVFRVLLCSTPHLQSWESQICSIQPCLRSSPPLCVSVPKTTRLPNGNSKEAAVMFLATFCSLVLYLQLQLDFCDGVRHIYRHLKFFKCLPWDLQWTSSSYALSLAPHVLCRKSGRPSLPKPESLEAAESALESRKSIGRISEQAEEFSHMLQ